MAVKQISIFVENKKGRLLAVTDCLGNKNINIRALSVADTSDYGILRLIVNNPEAAEAALKECGFTVSVNQVIAVEVPDIPGGFSSILRNMDKAGVNVEYSYAFHRGRGANALIVFRVDNQEAAAAALNEGGVRVLEDEEVYN